MLTTDPGMGVVRHADAGYEEALAAARSRARVDLPSIPSDTVSTRRVRRFHDGCSFRDLAQLATPAGSAAPLRGEALREIEVTRDAFVLCEDGRIVATGRMRDLPRLDGDVEELDGRGLSAIPGLVDCHTHACFAGDRVEEFSLRAAGASYEELHARGGGILSTVRATRAAGEAGLAAALAEHVGWMLRAGTTTFEAKSGYGLDRETELAQLRAVRDAGGVPTWLGAHALPPEFADEGGDAYVDFLIHEVLPEAAEIAEAADVFLERGAFDGEQARAISTACRDAGLDAPPARRPVHGVGSDPARDRARRPLGRPPRGDGAGGHRGARGERRHRRPAPGERALPEPPDAARARARRRGRRGRARDRLQPRQRLLREPAARLLARGDADGARARGGARPRAR